MLNNFMLAWGEGAHHTTFRIVSCPSVSPLQRRPQAGEKAPLLFRSFPIPKHTLPPPQIYSGLVGQYPPWNDVGGNAGTALRGGHDRRWFSLGSIPSVDQVC